MFNVFRNQTKNITTHLASYICDGARRNLVHLDYLRDVSLDFLARKFPFSASVVFNYVGTIAFTVNFFCGGGRGENSFEGLSKVIFSSGYLLRMTRLNQKGTFEQTLLEIILVGGVFVV